MTANIEKELLRLRDNGSQGDKAKACLFNLIVFTSESRCMSYFQGLVDMIMERFPCRVMFIRSSPSDKSLGLRISVATRLGCDQVTIETGSTEQEKIPFLILPHFVSDLPVYLLWGEDPSIPNPLFAPLEKLCQRIIFDSAFIENLANFSKTILNPAIHPDSDIVDINWARMRGWREIFAQTFDTPERIEALKNAKALTIWYNKTTSELLTHQENQAFCLQGWLAAQLGWSFQNLQRNPEEILLQYKTIAITLRSTATASFLPEEIMKIEITGDKDMLCDLVRQGPSQVIVHWSTADKCDLPFTLLLPDIKKGKTFMREIFYEPASAHYTNMLRMVSGE